MAFLQTIRAASRQQPTIVIFVALMCFFLGQICTQGAWALLGWVWNGDPTAVASLSRAPISELLSDLTLFRGAHLVAQLLSWGFAAWAAASMLGRPMHVLQLSRKPPVSFWMWAPILILVAAPLAQALMIDRNWAGIGGMSDWLSDMRTHELALEARTEAIIQYGGLGQLFINLFIFAALPAVCEEAFFRGVLQRVFAEKMPAVMAILVTAVLFSLVHMQFFGFFARLFLGTLLGFLTYKSQSLWPAILAHFTFNGVTVISVYTGWGKTIEAIPLIYVILSIMGTAALMWLIARKSVPKQSLIQA